MNFKKHLINIIVSLIFCCTLSYASYQKGVEFFDLSRYVDAMKAFKAAIKNQEQVGDSYAYIGKIFFRAREYQKAYSAYLRAVKSGSESPELILQLAQCMDKLKGVMELPDFVKLYKSTFDKKVYAVPIVYHLISYHRNRNEFKNILEIYQKVANEPSFELGQKEVPNYTSLIFLYVGLAYDIVDKNTITAMKLAEKSIRYDPLNGAARKLFERLSKSQKKAIENLYNKAEKLFNQRDFTSASELYNQVLALKPSHLEASRGIEECKLASTSYKALDEARKLFEADKHEASLDKVNWAITAYPQNYEALNLKKDIKSKLLKKLNIKALQDEEKKSRERRYFSLLSQANNLVINNQFEEALNLLREIFEIRPDSAKAKAIMMEAEKKKSQYATFKKAQDHFKAQEWKLALDGFLEVQKTDLRLLGLEQSIIICNFRLGNFEDSVALSRSYLNSRSENPDVLYYLGRSYESLMQRDTSYRNLAIDTYTKLIRLDDSFLDTKSRLTAIQRAKWGPIIFITLIALVFVMLFIWLFKTRRIRAKYAYMNRVDQLLNKKDYEQLSIAFNNFYEIDFTMKETLKYLPNFMLAMVETRRFDQCLQLGPKVLGVMPEHRQVKVLMGRANYLKGSINPSLIKFYLALLDSEYITDEIISWTGNKILELDIAKEETLPILKRFNALHPENEACRKVLIEFLGKEKIINQQLIEVMQLEIKYNESDTKCRLRLAEHYLKKKQLDDCVRLCEEVINLNVNDKKLHPILYGAYEAMQNLEALVPLYESLLQLYPNSITLQQAQNKILIATGHNALSQTKLNTYQSDDNSSA